MNKQELKEIKENVRHKKLITTLNNISKELKGQDKEVVKAVEKVLSGKTEITVNKPDEVSVKNFPEQKEVKIPEYPTEIKVTNFPEQQQFPKIPEIKIPDKVEVKKPSWFKSFSDNRIVKQVTTSALAIINGFKIALEEHQEPKNALAVKLIDENGNVYTAWSGGGGGGGGITGPIEIKAPSVCGNGQTTVAAAGTAVVLAAATNCKSVTVKALAGNSANVYVGSATVTAANGFVLDNGDTVSIDIDNLDDIYIDVDTNGEGVSYIYVQ